LILIGLLAIFVIGGVAVLLIIIVSNSRKAEGGQQFEVLPDPEPEITPKPGKQIPPQDFDGDRTVRLFDPSAYGSALRSYVLEIYDLRHPGQVYRVNVDDKITIGRGAQCTVRIPNRTLSAKHCEIVLKEGKLLLCDLDSLNGTYLNGNPDKVKEAYLESGSIIQIGSEKLQVQLREVNG